MSARHVWLAPLVLGAAELGLSPNGLASQEPARPDSVRPPAAAEPAAADPAPVDSSGVAATRPRLLVTGMAGATLYLSFEEAPPDVEPGAPAGPGATLVLAASDGGPPLGRLRVIERVGRRLLARFDGEAFPLTRGTVLYLVTEEPGADGARRADGSADRSADRSEPRAPDRATVAPPAPLAASLARSAPRIERVAGPRLSGLVAFESDLRRSTSTFSGFRDGTVDRTFATPGGRLRATLSGLPAGTRVHASLRAFHRERDSRRPLDESRVQLFEAWVEAAPDGAPLLVRGGRFLNRYEAFTGYWDGGLLRVGGRSFGVGAAAGWEPALREERLERDLFKVAGFVDFEARSRSVRWAGSLSGLRLAPRDGGDPRHVLGAAQRLSAGRLRLHANVEVERDEAASRWLVARLNAGASIGAGPLTLRARLSRLRGPADLAFDPALDARRAGARVGEARDRAGGGASLRVAGGSLGGDVSFGRDRSDRDSRTYAAHLLLPRTLPGDLELRLNGFRWENELDHYAVSASAGLARRFGRVRIEAGYRYDRSDRVGLPIVSHGLQVGLSVRASGGWSYRMDGFARRGPDIETDRLYGRLSKSF